MNNPKVTIHVYKDNNKLIPTAAEIDDVKIPVHEVEVAKTFEDLEHGYRYKLPRLEVTLRLYADKCYFVVDDKE